MTPPQHLWFFTLESLRRMAANAGLQVEETTHPWKIVPLSLMIFQLQRLFGFQAQGGRRGNEFGVPINLFDAMRVILRKPPS
jgi:hypothetical protein